MAKKITSKTSRTDIPHRSGIHWEANWEAEDVADYIDGDQSASPNAGRRKEHLRGRERKHPVIGSVIALGAVALGLILLNVADDKQREVDGIQQGRINNEQVSGEMEYVEELGQLPPDVAGNHNITGHDDLVQNPGSDG